MVSATSNVDDLGPAAVLGPGIRDLASRPFTSWYALEPVADAALSEPLLRVLDEFPVLEASPEPESVLQRDLEPRTHDDALRILLSGSPFRTMEAIQEERSPLFGRVDLALLLEPFSPDEVCARPAPAFRS